MLLARMAEAVYWAGRYLERAEDTARIVQVHGETHVDLPVGEDVGWVPLVRRGERSGTACYWASSRRSIRSRSDREAALMGDSLGAGDRASWSAVTSSSSRSDSVASTPQVSLLPPPCDEFTMSEPSLRATRVRPPDVT